MDYNEKTNSYTTRSRATEQPRQRSGQSQPSRQRPASSGQTRQSSGSNQNFPPRRRRRRRKPPYKSLAICAGIIFAVGFLLGFLIRGLFIPDAEDQTAETSAPTEIIETTAAPEPSTEATEPTEFHVGNVSDDWRLYLVNKWNPLEDEYTMDLMTLSNGLQVNARCYDDLTAMLSAMEEAGLSPIVCSAYRSISDQQSLYQSKVNDYLSAGYTQAEAEEMAGTVVAIPGTSEHHLGLAVDIVDENYQLLDEKQEETEVQKWLMENCWNYGFILRYPNNTSDTTGIIYEPWHYRYVGKEAAQDMKVRGLCLEDYLATVEF